MMKNAILFSVLFCLTIYSAQAQNTGGMSFALGLKKTASLDFFLKRAKNRFHFGMSYEFNDAKGKAVETVLSNYGQTQTGHGTYFWTIDIGYCYIIKNRISIGPEISVGGEKSYTNYKDDRFNGDGYHISLNTGTAGGLGLNVGYSINKYIEVFSGYHTLKGVPIGLRLTFAN